MTARCARCNRRFTPRRKGHVYCSRRCRYACDEQVIERADEAAIERLFDPDRDPNELVREDEWYPAPSVDGDDESWNTLRELDLVSTVAARRRLYLGLKDEGMVI